MKHGITATYKNVRLRPLEIDDIENLRRWRNDPNNTRFLTTLPYITEDMQKKWYEGYLQEQGYFVFAIDETDVLCRLVGSIALYNISDTCCEYGRFMIGDPGAKGKKVGLNSLLLCVHTAFEKLGVQRCIASVHEENISARKIDERAGFSVYGRHPFVKGGDELEIEVDKERFYNLYPDLTRVQIDDLTEDDKCD